MLNLVIHSTDWSGVIDVLTDVSDRGGTFTHKAVFKVEGGFQTASITVKRDADLVMSNLSPCSLWDGEEKIWSGWITDFDDPSSVKSTQDISVESAWQRASILQLTETYVSATLEDVLSDVSDLLIENGITTGISQSLDYSDIEIITLDYDSKPLDEVFEQLLELVNNQYEQHAIYIDEDRVLHVELVSQDKDYLFQNIHYQNGVYSKLPPLFNSLTVYTTVSVAGISAQVDVGTLTNSVSEQVYGTIEESIVFSNEIDEDTALMMGEAYLKYNSSNGYAITLKNMVGRSVLDFKKYIIQTERYTSRYTLEGSTDLSQWDITNLLATEATIDEDKYYTGNQSLSLVLEEGSDGEQIVYQSEFLVGVSSVNITYQTVDGATATMIAQDSLGNEIVYLLASPDVWSSITISPQAGTEEYNLRINDSVLGYCIVGVTDDSSGEEVDYQLQLSSNQVLIDIVSLTISFTSEVGTLYIDQLGVKGDTIGYYDEVVSGYTLEAKNGELMITEATFGQKEQTPLEQLSGSISKTDLLYNNLASEG